MVENSTTIINSNNTISMLVPFFSAVLGAFVGAGLSILYARWQANQEYRSLILSFCSELVSTFKRCTQYYRQSKIGEVSYSTLFSFTDSSALSKFASVCQNPEVVVAIIELKSMYFQIQRHVEEATLFALEGSRTLDRPEQMEMMAKARHAQGTALAFFNSSYDRIKKETTRLVEITKQEFPGAVSNDLSSRFSEALEEKKAADKAVAS